MATTSGGQHELERHLGLDLVGRKDEVDRATAGTGAPDVALQVEAGQVLD
jgi:hypothetical protein